MSNIVRTWEDEANPAQEIELTDAQLAAVVGAWDDNCYSNYHPSCHPNYHSNCYDKKYHKKFEKKVKIHAVFEYEAESKEEEEFKKYWN